MIVVYLLNYFVYIWNCPHHPLFLKHNKNRKTLPREHLTGCQGVKMFLLKDPFKFCLLHNFRFVIFQILSQVNFFYFCHHLSPQVFVTIWFLSQFEFFVTTGVLSQFNLIIIQLFSLPFLDFELGTIWFFGFHHNLSFFSQSHHNLSFGLLVIFFCCCFNVKKKKIKLLSGIFIWSLLSLMSLISYRQQGR